MRDLKLAGFNVSQLGFDRWTLLLGVGSEFLAIYKAKHYGVPTLIFLRVKYELRNNVLLPARV
jgi:hypothetical protein